MKNPPPEKVALLIEVTGAFLKLGATAFGGPAAHIGMFRQEFVQRRKWLTDEQFLDLLGATNLIPGPNSTEMAIHLGFLRAGRAGLVAGGVAFTLPAMLIVLALSWAYVRFGSTPQAGWLLYGIKPVMIAIILQALWELGRKAIKDVRTAALGIAAVTLYFLGANEVLLLFMGGLALMLAQNWNRIGDLRRRELPLLLPFLPGLAVASVPFSLSTLFLTFLKIGAILYGSGYVLVAFLRADLVSRLGWLTEQQLIDAIAIGQITPGPLFTSATFIGYLLGGTPGALLATLGIFLPSFIFVAISNPIIPKLRQSPWAGSLLDGVIVASLGLMAATTWQLGRASLIDPLTILAAFTSLVILLRFKVNATWLIIAGAVLGLVAHG
jgi:chromate transporter